MGQIIDLGAERKREKNNRNDMAMKVARAMNIMCEAMMGDYVARTGFCCRMLRRDEGKHRTVFFLDTDSREKVDETQREAARDLATEWRERAKDMRGEDCLVVVETLPKKSKHNPGGVRVAVEKRDRRRIWTPTAPTKEEICLNPKPEDRSTRGLVLVEMPGREIA